MHARSLCQSVRVPHPAVRWSGTAAAKADVDRCWQSFLRRFDLEHTFRLFKQILGWTKPRLRSSKAADRWTWLVIAAYVQLRLARPLATDCRRPWEKPAPPLTSARVRSGFRNLCTRTGSLASAPKASRPGRPGWLPGSKNRPATRHDVDRVLAIGEAYSRSAPPQGAPNRGAARSGKLDGLGHVQRARGRRTSRGTSVDLSSVIIAVAGVAGTLGGALLTQRGSQRAKRLEIELVRDHEEVREARSLRRTCYAELNRDARQFNTALNRHLHVMRERGVEEADSDALEEAKNAHRDRYSEAQMIAPEEVLRRASVVNQALNKVYGQVKRLERGAPEPGETMETAAQAQYEVWEMLRTMRTAMRHDLGISHED